MRNKAVRTVGKLDKIVCWTRNSIAETRALPAEEIRIAGEYLDAMHDELLHVDRQHDGWRQPKANLGSIASRAAGEMRIRYGLPDGAQDGIYPDTPDAARHFVTAQAVVHRHLAYFAKVDITVFE